MTARQSLDLSAPWLNAAGSLGYAPPARWPLDLPWGGFVTRPISRRPRSPAENRGLLPFPGGWLMHTGWPNPGVRAVLKNFGPRWARSALPVWAHLLASDPQEIYEMSRMLEGLEGLAAFQIGLPPGIQPDLAAEMIAAAGQELPAVAVVALNDCSTLMVETLARAGAAALALAPPRGALPDGQGNYLTGRLYGPALLPLVLHHLQLLRESSLPLIAACGVYSQADGEALLAAGAWAVQVDTWLWG